MFSRFVAIGDSFTEGVGDPHPDSRNGVRGWADRVAAAMAAANPEMRYANLAVRGRRMERILSEQVQTALMLEPDVVTIYAGMNDLMLPRMNLDTKMAYYADGLKALQQIGARVLAFTAPDIGTVPIFRRLRGRTAVYNELLRGIAADLDIQLLDFWRFDEFRDPRLWAGDRVHLSPLGHERMAAEVLDCLGVSHQFASASAAVLSSAPPVRGFQDNLWWATAFAAPWIAKRIRRVPAGAGIEPKSTDLVRVL